MTYASQIIGWLIGSPLLFLLGAATSQSMVATVLLSLIIAVVGICTHIEKNLNLVLLYAFIGGSITFGAGLLLWMGASILWGYRLYKRIDADIKEIESHRG